MPSSTIRIASRLTRLKLLLLLFLQHVKELLLSKFPRFRRPEVAYLHGQGLRLE
jgi:hypothetical protein